jgi:hypothetical protein
MKKWNWKKIGKWVATVAVVVAAFCIGMNSEFYRGHGKVTVVVSEKGETA